MVLDQFWARLKARFKEKRNQLLFNIGVGLAILLLVTFFEHKWWGWEEDEVNSGLDILVRIENKHYTDPLMLQKLAKSPVFFIEITHEDRRKWRFPELTPRDRLARMVADAWKRGASVIVLDVLMERPEQGDSELEKVLQRMLKEDAFTHVIFPVTINCDGQLVKNRFDQLIDSSTKDQRHIFHRGISIAEASGSDFLYRYWTAYQTYVEGKNMELIWNVGLLAAAIQEQKMLELSRIANEIKATKDDPKSDHAEFGIVLGGRFVKIPFLDRSQPNATDIPVAETECIKRSSHSDIFAQRISFRLPVRSPLIKLTADKFDGNENLLREIPGKVVVIGNTCPDLADYHWTPVGKMAGLHILGNTINTIIQGLQPQRIHRWFYLIIEGAIIVVAAVVFLLVPPVLAQMVTTLFFVFVLFIISCFLFFNWGVFINFVSPVLVMGLHRFCADWEAIIHEKRKQAQENLQ